MARMSFGRRHVSCSADGATIPMIQRGGRKKVSMKNSANKTI